MGKIPTADEIEREFLKMRKGSPAARLMCPRTIHQLHYSDNDGAYAAIAFIAYANNLLPRLDEVINRFKITECATPRFKKRLREKWLDVVPDRDIASVRRSSGNVFSALSELLVADYIGHGNIINLEAWDDKSADIQYSNYGAVRNAEIKYLGKTPELEANILDQLKGAPPKGEWFDMKKCADYMFSRIAKAADQLKHYHQDAREAWLVFSPFSQRQIFESSYLNNQEQWNDIEFVKSLSETFPILEKSPIDWLKEIDTLTLATLKDWHLTNVNQYKFN